MDEPPSVGIAGPPRNTLLLG